MAKPTTDDDNLLSSIRRHLDGLKSTRDGKVLYNLIERGLKRYGETGQIERAFVNFITALLGRYAKDSTYDAGTRIRARLIQQRLALHLTGGTPAPAKTPPPAPEKKTSPPAGKIQRETVTAKARTVSTEEPLESLEQELVDRVTESIAADGAIPSPDSPDSAKALSEFEDLKGVLVKGLDELIRERHALIRRIDGATGYIQALENDRRKLGEELSKARKHGLVDQLTGLPQRDIFVRSLEAEVGRVRRYGFSFALALIDLDGMKKINDKYGREAGDAILRCYASEIFSRFRAYDLVARYGADEFAVLFPNTQKDGALRALEKAQKTATSTYVTHDDRSLRLPSFSSVLTVYAQGEKPAQLLKRAADALDRARIDGSNRIVVSLPSA